VFNIFLGEPSPPQLEIDPRRQRLICDIDSIQRALRSLDLHELQNMIEEQMVLYDRAPSNVRRNWVYPISCNQIVFASAIELLRSRLELPNMRAL